MALIPRLVKGITEAFSTIGKSIARGAKTMITEAFAARERREGAKVVDVIESITHADPESIAPKLNQTVKTISRLVDTEPTVVAYPWDAEIRRNLIVSGRLKAARRYRIFYQADPIIDGSIVGPRQWYSFYTDELKTFGEYAGDIAANIEANRSTESFSLGNVTFHHVLHQRGAKF